MSVAEFHLDAQGIGERRLETGPRVGAVFAARGRRALQIPHLLRHSRSGPSKSPSRMEDAGPPPAARQSVRSGGRGAHRSECQGDLKFAKLGSLVPALLPERREQRSAYALRTAVQQLHPDHGARYLAEIARPAGDSQPPDALRRSGSAKTRGCCPIRAARSRATACCRNTSAFPEKFFFLDLTGLRTGRGSRLRRTARKSSS